MNNQEFDDLAARLKNVVTCMQNLKEALDSESGESEVKPPADQERQIILLGILGQAERDFDSIVSKIRSLTERVNIL